MQTAESSSAKNNSVAPAVRHRKPRSGLRSAFATCYQSVIGKASSSCCATVRLLGDVADDLRAKAPIERSQIVRRRGWPAPAVDIGTAGPPAPGEWSRVRQVPNNHPWQTTRHNQVGPPNEPRQSDGHMTDRNAFLPLTEGTTTENLRPHLGQQLQVATGANTHEMMLTTQPQHQKTMEAMWRFQRPRKDARQDPRPTF